MRYLKFLMLSAVLGLLSACGGGDVSVVPAVDTSGTPAVDVAGFNGIWNGSYTSNVSGQTCDDLQGLIYNGQVQAASETCGEVLVGSLTVDADIASIRFDSFAADGSGTSGTASFSGSYTIGSVITGDYTTSDNDSGSFTMSYNIIYENNSSLALTAARWAFSETINNTTYLYFFQVDSAGNLTSLNTVSGCRYTGALSILDSNYNLYAVNLTAAGCTGDLATRNGSYTGVTSLAGDNQTMTVLAANDQNVFFADFLQVLGGGN